MTPGYVQTHDKLNNVGFNDCQAMGHVFEQHRLYDIGWAHTRSMHFGCQLNKLHPSALQEAVCCATSFSIAPFLLEEGCYCALAARYAGGFHHKDFERCSGRIAG